jgi:hypothetical protein
MTLRQERRLTPRYSRADDHLITRVRVKPGQDAHLVDASSRGVLIDTSGRLLPGAGVELQLRRHDTCLAVRGVVLRSFVARLRPNEIVYRSAIRLEPALQWFEAVHPSSDPTTDACIAAQ